MAMTELKKRKLFAGAALTLNVGSWFWCFPSVAGAFRPYAVVGLWLPGAISLALLLGMRRLRASKKLCNKKIYKLEGAAFCMSFMVSGSLLGHLWPSAEANEAFTLSICMIFWGWLVETGAGLGSNLGLTGSTGGLVLGAIRNLQLPISEFCLYMLLPMAIVLFLKYLTYKITPGLFDNQPNNKEHGGEHLV